MGKIRVITLGDEETEKAQQASAKKRRQVKKEAKEKAHIKGVGLKGGQQIKVMEGVELKPEIAAALVEQPVDEKPKKAKKIKVRLRSQRFRQLSELVNKSTTYNIKDTVKLLKKTSNTAFAGTVEAHVNINPLTLPKDKLSLSGTVNLPHGTGKKRVIAIADEALIKKVSEGKIEFDVLVAQPAMMPKLAKVAKILGPKGLMPSPKTGTVTTDPEKRVKELSGGEIAWKTEPDHPVIHQALGKTSFTEKQIEENITAFVASIGANKIAKLTLNATMGPGIKLDVNNL